MKKKLLFALTLIALLMSCASERSGEEASGYSGGSQVTNPDSLPVAFDAYQSRNITRSGWAGLLDVGQLKETKANGGGFGVFAYYTDLKKYDQTYVPNFMYNQGVFWKGAEGTISEDYWAYSPIVYWPNEYGFDASSDDEDHLSFFAYAPYTQHASAAAGSVTDATYGIVGFSRNNATGDPMVRYIASFEPSKSVDLCWGVVPSDKTSWAKIQNGSTQTLREGLPWLDVERPMEAATQAGATSSSRIKFKFNHALAQLNVQIDTDADITTHTTGVDALGAETKVYVRSISFTGIALQGALNLNNTTPNQALWLDWCGCTDLSYGQSVTIYDGRRDSREGALGAEASNETPTGLNPAIIQNSAATNGVQDYYQNLFKPTSTDPDAALDDAICVIPTGEAMTITIVYDIETANPKLATYLSDGTTHGSSIENRITKTVSFNNVAGAGLESNKRYALKLHLGMNSVKFDAEVQDWVSTTVNGEGWLPSNVRPITLSQSVMYLGAAQTLTATTDPAGNPVSWENSDDGIATIPSSSPYMSRGTRGVQSIASGVTSGVTVTPVALGTTTITATRTDTGDKATCTVKVVPVTLKTSTIPANIAISESITQGSTLVLTAETFPAASGIADASDWTTSNSTVASIAVSGTKNETCTVTANSVGSATITVTFGVATAKCTLTVTADPPTVTATPALTSGWTYDASAHDLATAGTVSNGTMYYLATTSTTAPSASDAGWNTTIPQATNAGTYYVWYKVIGNTGYSDIAPTKITSPTTSVVVAKAAGSVTLSASSGSVYAKGKLLTFTVTGNTSGGTLGVSSSATSTATASLSSSTVSVDGVASGTATITVTSNATTNYNTASATYSVTVNAKTANMNPLYYVDTYNVTGSTPARGSSDTDNYFYNYSDANSISISGYHLPSQEEWFSIFPADYMASSESVLGTTHYAASTSSTRTKTVKFRFDATTQAGISDESLWVSTGNTVSYAIRFIGTDYCSVWKYELTGSGDGSSSGYRLEVSSALIDYCKDATEANTWYTNNSGSLSTLFNGSLGSTNKFYARGYATGTSASATNVAGADGCYWSSSSSGSNGWHLDSSSAYTSVRTDTQSYGFSVRLFRDL